jgi:cyclophilin family peptidyl-prolyl cis-trans isomerase
MAVLLETSKGDLVIDLLVDDAPMACKNFLKLCKWVQRRSDTSWDLGRAADTTAVTTGRAVKQQAARASPLLVLRRSFGPQRNAASLPGAGTPDLLPPICRMKYYNNCIFHNVQKDFIAQTGDPTGTGRGGDSIWG